MFERKFIRLRVFFVCGWVDLQFMKTLSMTTFFTFPVLVELLISVLLGTLSWMYWVFPCVMVQE